MLLLAATARAESPPQTVIPRYADGKQPPADRLTGIYAGTPETEKQALPAVVISEGYGQPIAQHQGGSTDPKITEPAVLNLVLEDATIDGGTWDDYGCVPDEPTADNGPALTKMLAQQGRGIDVPPVGKMRTYYVSTTIVWPAHTGGALMGSGGYAFALGDGQYKNGLGGGVTRLIWNGKPGEPMILYQGCGGRIENLMLQGQPLKTPDDPLDHCAGAGIRVVAGNTPPSGTLTTRGVAFVALDHGIEAVGKDRANHADHLTHYSPLFHRVRIPYYVDGFHSVVHTMFAGDIRFGYETVFDFRRGGKLEVFGLYVSNTSYATSTLLRIGRPNFHNDGFVVRGLEVDSAARGLRLVEHGQYAGRVRIDGHIGGGATLADPIVAARSDERPTTDADILIDMRGAK